MSYRARVSLAEPGGQMRIAGQALNLSVAGMFVHAAGSCALGSDVLCDMPLPTGMCQVKGRVTRVQRLPEATGMAIQFVDLSSYQQTLLNDLIDRSREPSIPLAVRFEGIASPIQCRGVFFDDKLRLRTKLPFLRVGSNVQVSMDGNHAELPASADMTGTLSAVALKASPIDGVPRLSIDLDVTRSEIEGDVPTGSTPLEQAIASCVSSPVNTNTPTPTPVPLQIPKTPRPQLIDDDRPSVMVSGELNQRPRTRTEEFEAPAIDAGALLSGDPPTEAVAANDTGAPQARSRNAEWEDTGAIADRRRQAGDRRAAEGATTASRARPVALLCLVGALGLALGAFLVRSGLSMPAATTSARETSAASRPAAATPATAPIAPTIVDLHPATTEAKTPPASSATATATAVPTIGRSPTPARRVIRRPRPVAPLAFDPATRQYKLSGVASLDLGGAKLTGLTGLIGAASANLRGINVAVELGATTLHVTFPTPEPDGAYGVTVTPSWATTSAIAEKTAEGFTITFATPAPGSATFDWLLVH
ncbi:MAG TPA: PilZ domain-containing protein [Polyangia bacterium]|nr:PilZ domain-containing protein [Polyangia bacterium]